MGLFRTLRMGWLGAGFAVVLASLPACQCSSGGQGATCSSAGDCNVELVCAPNGKCESWDSNAALLPDGGHAGVAGGCQNLQCAQVSCANGKTTTLTGMVFDPSGTLPIYNSIVYIPNGPPQAFSEGVSCERCGGVTSGLPLVVALTGSDGTFALNNVPAGRNIPLIFQIGKWRRQVVIPNVPACQATALTDVNLQRLPRNHTEGDIPQMAIATGSSDPMECLLLKMGIDAAEFTNPNAAGRIHMYVQNGVSLNPATPPASDLWSDAGTLKQYDVVLLPCEGAEHAKPANAVENVVDYASAGGRLFATHFSYVWTDSSAAPSFQAAAEWTPNANTPSINPPNPFGVSVDTNFPKGQAFHDWLSNVNALTAGVMELAEARTDVGGVSKDAGTSQWLSGVNGNNGSQVQVEHLTFNTPIFLDGGTGQQCGRVVFSDFHVVADGGVTGSPTFPSSCVQGTPFTAQEKALVFMLFDVSSCIQSDNSIPEICPAAGESCSTASPCCSGLACVDANFNACAGNASCTCEPTVN